MIRIAIVCTAALFLSSCSWLGNWNGNSAGQRMNLELAIGVDQSIDGDLISTAFDNSGTAELVPTDFNDAFGRSTDYQLGLSYAVTDTVEVTAALNYSKATGNTIEVGNVSAVDPITADIDDLETYGGEVGVRKYFRNKTFAHLLSPAVSPYIGANIGIKHVKSIGAQFSSTGFPGAGLPASFHAELYQDDYVPTGQITVGAEWRATRNFAIGLETGVRYTGELSDGNTVLSDVGWEEAQGDTKNISIPVTLRGRFKF